MATRPGGSRQLSRMGTPVRKYDRLSSVGGSEGGNMDVDDASEIIIERGLKFETIFAKSEELQVSFYAHLPAEVKLLLRNAGENGVLLCPGNANSFRLLP